MHGWQDWQWILYYAAQWITGLSYMAIAYRSWKHRNSPIERRVEPPGSFVVTAMFVITCGWHHFAHPPLMQYGTFGAFVWMMSIDWLMAGISVVAAVRLEVNDRRF